MHTALLKIMRRASVHTDIISNKGGLGGDSEGGEKPEKNHANKKDLKKIHGSDMFKMREDIFKKKTYIHS